MAGPGRRVGIIAAALAAPLLWEIAVGAMLERGGTHWSELALLIAAKGGFALLLALAFTAIGLWRACGFAGGLRRDRWPLLWPIWLAAGLSALQAAEGVEWRALPGWLLVAAAVGFGEEGVFRGLVILALGRQRPYRVVLVSAALFGLIHLVGLITPIDPRMIAAQAVVAFGLGLVLGATRLIAGSIWPGLIVHTALDFFGLAAGGGISGAMAFSSAALAYLLVAAAISIAWGAVLLRRLPQLAPHPDPL